MIQMNYFPSAEDAMLEKMEREELVENLKALPTMYKQALELYYLKGFSYKTLSLRLTVTMEAVKSRLYRARKLLRNKAEYP